MMKLATLLLILVAPSWATNYYINGSTGNDGNPGTLSLPWQTITRVNSGTYSPGDSINFSGGQTFSGNAVFTTGSCGTQSNPITITSYGSGYATINGGTGSAIEIYECGGYTVNNLITVGSGNTTNTGVGVFAYLDLANTTLYGITFGPNLTSSGFNYGFGIGSFNGASGYTNVLIQGVNAFGNNEGLGIYGDNSPTNAYFCHTNLNVINSTFHDNPGTSGGGNGMFMSSVNGGSIKYSLAYNNASNANGGVGFEIYEAQNIVLEYNESHHNHTNGVNDGDGFDCDGGSVNCTMQYNYSHDNDGAGFLDYAYGGGPNTTGTTIRYNVSQNDGRKNGNSCVRVGNGSTAGTGLSGSEIYNNTCYISGIASQSVDGMDIPSGNSTTNVHFRNNIIAVSAGTGGTVNLVNVPGSHTGLLFQNNDYWAYSGATNYNWGGTNYTTFAAWQTASGQEKIGGTNVGLTEDPGLVSPGNGQTLGLLGNSQLTAYRLASDSTITFAGQNMQSAFSVNPGNQDFWGYGIPYMGGYSVGASQVPFTTPAARAFTVCPSGCNYADPNSAESALTSLAPNWPILDAPYIFEWTAGDTFTQTVNLLSPNNGQGYFTCTETSGSAALSCPVILDPQTAVKVVTGMTVAGLGVPTGVTVSSITGTGPYTVTLTSAPTLATAYCSSGASPCQTCTWNGSSVVCTQVGVFYFGSAQWVVHRSSAECAPPGQRAGSQNTTYGPSATITPVAGMALLITPSGRSPAIQANPTNAPGAPGVSYHRFECLELAESTVTNQEVFQVVQLGNQPPGGQALVAQQASAMAHHNAFNHIYSHAYVDPANSNFAHAFITDSAYLEITNSTLMAFHTSEEAHGFATDNSIGPFYLRNNEFESTGIGTIFGGNAPNMGGAKVTGAQFIGNYYYRPWLWRVTSGTATPANTFSPSTCLYDSNGGESYYDATSNHTYLCVAGTWTDQGAGTPAQPYCNTGTCTAGGAPNLVCTTTAMSTAVTCNDTTGVSPGMLMYGPGPATLGTGASVSTVNSGTSLTLNVNANYTATGTAQFILSSGFGGSFPYCVDGCSFDKNQEEFKEVFGALSDGNWWQNGWAPGLASQSGECLLQNKVDSNLDDVVSYVTYTNNRCDSTPQGLAIGQAGINPYVHENSNSVLINNLFTNIGLPQITLPVLGIGSATMTYVGNFDRTVYQNNTMLLNNSQFGMLGNGVLTCMGNTYGFLAWSSNVANIGYGSWYDQCDSLGFGNSSPGFNVLANDYATSDLGLGTIIVTTQSACEPGAYPPPSGNCGQIGWANGGCNGCTYPTSLSTTFQSYPANLAVASAYQGTGYLGYDPGADINVVTWSTNGNSGCPGSTPCGAPNAYLDFRIKDPLVMPTSVTWYSYRALDTGACTVTIATQPPAPGSTTLTSGIVYGPTSDGGGNPERSLTVTGLTAKTEYWYTFVCTGSVYRRGNFSTP